MVTQDTLRTLLERVERVGDDGLRAEMRQMVATVQNGYAEKFRQLNVIRAENDSLKSQLARNGLQPAQVIVYDPPV